MLDGKFARLIESCNETREFHAVDELRDQIEITRGLFHASKFFVK